MPAVTSACTARRAAIADVLADEAGRSLAVGVEAASRVTAYAVTCGAIGTARESLHLDDLGRRADLGGDFLGAGRAVHDHHEVLLDREGDHDLEQELVELRFGQGIGALHLEGVLRREDEERRIELVALLRDGDLVLLHRLEQARLGLGRRPVYLVGQDEVGEDRAGLELEDALPASSMRMFMPVMSAGIRSGANWIRLNEQSMTSATWSV